MDFSIFNCLRHMTALEWLGRRDWFLYKDIPDKKQIFAQSKKISLKDDPNTIFVNQKEINKHPKEFWDSVEEILSVIRNDVIGILWYDSLAKAISNGPKIFIPTSDQCEALENAEARYSFEEYKQPFPVIILEIPIEYKENLKINYGVDESPQYVIVNKDEKNEFITISAFYHSDKIITHIIPNRKEYLTLEESLVHNRERRKDSLFNHKNLSQETQKEFDAAENVMRLGINFAMMMSLYTVRVEGYLNPENFKMLERESKAKNSSGQMTKKALESKNKMLASIQQIKFDQNIKFYDEIEEYQDPQEKGGTHRSPCSHWRRGHFAMQACGAGRKERKMIFRKPLLVRAKYFIGEMKDTTTTYTIQKR